MTKLIEKVTAETLRTCIKALKKKHSRSPVARQALDELLEFVASSDEDFSPGSHMALHRVRAGMRSNLMAEAREEFEGNDTVMRQVRDSVRAEIRTEEYATQEREGYPLFVLSGGRVDPTFVLRLHMMSENSLRELLDDLEELRWTDTAGQEVPGRPATRGEADDRCLVLTVPGARLIPSLKDKGSAPLSPAEWTAIQEEVQYRRRPPMPRTQGRGFPFPFPGDTFPCRPGQGGTY